MRRVIDDSMYDKVAETIMDIVKNIPANKGGVNMLEFKTREELQNCEELQNMCRYEWQTVKLNGREVIACTTNQQYEDIIWGGIQEILEKLDGRYGTNIAEGDLASEARDFILARLEEDYGIEFVDVFDEY